MQKNPSKEPLEYCAGVNGVVTLSLIINKNTTLKSASLPSEGYVMFIAGVPSQSLSLAKQMTCTYSRSWIIQTNCDLTGPEWVNQELRQEPDNKIYRSFRIVRTVNSG